MKGALSAETTLVGAWTPAELAALILARPATKSSWAARIAATALDLHRTLGLETNAVRALAGELIEKEAIIVRLAHQPNLFPYTQLLAQTAYLHTLAALLRAKGRVAVPVIFLVDYDVASTQRVRQAQILDGSVKGQVSKFEISISAALRDVPIHHCPPPSDADRNTMLHAARRFAAHKRVLPDFLIEQSGLLRDCATLGDFNAFAWVNCVVRLWELPILFVRLSDLAAQSETARWDLAARLGMQQALPPHHYLWNFCGQCRRRVAAGAACCGIVAPAQPHAPKVLLDNLADVAIYGVSGGTSYGGSAPHIMASVPVAASIGLDLAPEAVWALKPPHPDLVAPASCSAHARKLVESGRCALLQNLLEPTSITTLRDRLLALFAI